MIPRSAGAAVQGASQVASTPKVGFGQVMKSPQAAKAQPAQMPQNARPAEHRPQASALIGEVSAAQAKLDQILKMAESGRTFSPAELLAFQAHAYRASQELDLAGKVVEKATSGVKQTLNTQV